MRGRSATGRCLAGASDVGLQPSGHLTPGEENTPAASQTLQADVRPQTHDHPIGRAAGMRLSQAEDIIHLEIG
jgi:hypothetical protein